ncbi:MAG TPA: hypothetical protein VNL39_05860 [Xanthobacteraceae bacterium]|nr:hypothetical protein [Xanthobacteraceae bacterium]
MDVSSVAAAIMATYAARAQLAVAGKLAWMDSDQAHAIAGLLEAAKANFDRLANVTSGLGTQLDITV